MRILRHSFVVCRTPEPAGPAGTAVFCPGERTRPHTHPSSFFLPPFSSAFTVLELVMVIGVLSVLLAIVLPTIKTVRAATLRRQAAAEATALAQAAIRYKTEYGFWPGQLEVRNKADGTMKLRPEFDTSAGQSWVSGIISRYRNTDFTVTAQSGSVAPVYIDDNLVYRALRRIGDLSGDTFESNPFNPKGLAFVDLTNESDETNVRYPDPWGNEYILIMGLNPRSTFTHKITSQGVTWATVSVSNTIAFAFSRGPDGARSTNYIYSAGVTP